MPTDMTLEALMARITELEIKQSYYESGHDALDQAVIRMQLRIDELTYEINKLKTVIASRPEQPVAPMSEEKPPPHY